MVVVRISDDGPGIDPELSARLFERFSRGDRSRSRRADEAGTGAGGTAGTGLGLSISEAIVHAHHGRIEVSSEPGRTTFTVRLPLLADEVR